MVEPLRFSYHRPFNWHRRSKIPTLTARFEINACGRSQISIHISLYLQNVHGWVSWFDKTNQRNKLNPFENTKRVYFIFFYPSTSLGLAQFPVSCSLTILSLSLSFSLDFLTPWMEINCVTRVPLLSLDTFLFSFHFKNRYSNEGFFSLNKKKEKER